MCEMCETEIQLVHTGVFVDEDDRIRLRVTIDPAAAWRGSGKSIEPWEVLQEIAKEKGLPPREDLYGLTTAGEIVYRYMHD